MTARLFCKTGELAGADYDVGEGAVLGSAKDNTIVLSATAVSKRDARIAFDSHSGCYFLHDLTGSGRTRLDGTPVLRKEKLGALHVITIAGLHDFIFRQSGKPAVAEARRSVSKTRQGSPGIAAAPSFESGRPLSGTYAGERPSLGVPAFQNVSDSEPAAKLEATQMRESGGPVLPTFDASDEKAHEAPDVIPDAPAATTSRFVLELEDDSGDKQIFPLEMGENRVGRSETCEVYVAHRSLSRDHAVLEVRRGSVAVRDSGSTNGTYVDSKRVTERVELKPGAKIRLGGLEGTIFWQD